MVAEARSIEASIQSVIENGCVLIALAKCMVVGVVMEL